jgi:hypothetical protein
MELAKHMPLSKVSEQVQETDKKLMRVINFYVKKSKEKADYSNITK